MKQHQIHSNKNIQKQKRICANHPLSHWKEGYKRCYWGFKLHQDCMQLLAKGGEKPCAILRIRTSSHDIRDNRQ